MAGVPHRLQQDSPYPETLAQANDNFDKLVSDTSDLGAKFSSTYASYSVTVAPGSMHSQLVGVTDVRPEYVAGRVQIAPRCEIFVDTDANDAYLLGYGASLSGEQLLSFKSVTVERRPAVNAIAAFLVQILNLGASPHTYYVRVDDSYINSPATGYFR